MQSVKRLLPWLHYPVVMIAVFAMFAWFQSLGLSLIVSTYVPVIFAAAAVTILELAFPNRTAWKPPAAEIKTDLVFMTTIQLALPPLVSFLFVYLLIGPVRALGLPITALWPHAWPIWIQAILMVLTVDLLRYWLHRLAHENDTLWRLHSVHHSVEQLYWLNTARFHPIEKTLQMSLDSLPFLLVGVHQQVLALYYLAYAANGFFQHCNVHVRYGPLNYIVGSAETHRWHHSRLPQESNANYGNTVIVWDLVFGTWFLPKDREIQDLGLQERDYPKTFLGMMRAPFRR
jgi:sterol desaturase/sphingolipid hydroxylase (fatty acid hydroxylase superfamily)